MFAIMVVAGSRVVLDLARASVMARVRYETLFEREVGEAAFAEPQHLSAALRSVQHFGWRTILGLENNIERHGLKANGISFCMPIAPRTSTHALTRTSKAISSTPSRLATNLTDDPGMVPRRRTACHQGSAHHAGRQWPDAH